MIKYGMNDQNPPGVVVGLLLAYALIVALLPAPNHLPERENTTSGEELDLDQSDVGFTGGLVVQVVSLLLMNLETNIS